MLHGHERDNGFISDKVLLKISYKPNIVCIQLSTEDESKSLVIFLSAEEVTHVVSTLLTAKYLNNVN